MQPVYGSEVDPVSGVMVDFGNDEAIKKAKDEAKAGKDGSDVEAMMWDNSKRLFAIAWVRTGEAPLDTVMELVGGPDRLANVVELGESGNATFYFCTYPSEDAEGLSEQSAEKYTRLCNDLDTAKKNIIMSQPPEQEQIEAGGAVNFTTQDFNGNEVSNDIFAENKVTMINIWGSFCQPCIEEMPALQTISEDMKAQGVAIVGVLGDAMDSDGNLDEDVVDLGKRANLYVLCHRYAKYLLMTLSYPVR